MRLSHKARRVIVAVVGLVVVLVWLVVNPASYEAIFSPVRNTGAEYRENNEEREATSEGTGASEQTGATGNVDGQNTQNSIAAEVLELLEVKGRAPKTGYKREEFYSGWPTVEGCNLRQKILKREFGDTAVLDGCNVVAGEFDEPYTGKHLAFTTREQISSGVQIDHVVALSDAWQKGAQYMDREVRYNIATDPLNLLAVDAVANTAKSDGDAATWLPPNKKFRCQYVARQISVKYKYLLWVTEAEKAAMQNILEGCPDEKAIGV